MLNNITLRGVEGIRRVFMMERPKSTLTKAGVFAGKGDSELEWTLETDGINLKKVMCIDGVDYRRTYSNNCVEIFQTLGIEAARAALLTELRNVIKFDGSYVNYRHLALLCDLMTSRGTLMAITRHGINRADTGALMRSIRRNGRNFGGSRLPWYRRERALWARAPFSVGLDLWIIRCQCTWRWLPAWPMALRLREA
jgi:DNA-directed RNA polymerase beta' subunit